MSNQSTNQILMVRPAAFQYNEQTAESNDYQQKPKEKKADVLKIAQKEFDAMVDLLRSHEIDVHVIEDTKKPVKPDAVFPNNWFTTHPDGKIFLYPMKSENRRLERRPEILDYLRKNFEVNVVLDWSFYEEDEDRALEGTGSMVIDTNRKIIYACESPRTDVYLLKKYAKAISHKCILFHAFKRNGAPQYHTNVVMCVGTAFAVICLDAIPDEKEKEKIIKNMGRAGKELIEISQEQLEENFAGNMLEVKNENGGIFIVMSTNAFESLDADQRERLGKHGQLIHTDLSTIETVGGGSARCMLAEIFLKKK